MAMLSSPLLFRKHLIDLIKFISINSIFVVYVIHFIALAHSIFLLPFAGLSVCIRDIN